jgi:hypothetical protein
MSNPTSNFNWQMPTATDLVTDLPADFEVFGQAVDTSLADLKGGTSGQILAKNTNADMDFVWITNDVGDITAVTAGTGISGGGTSGAVTITNSMATEITAKGDLIVGTGNAAFDNLPAGTNGHVLTADSTVSPSGLKWAAPVSGLTLISTQTASNVASITFDNVFSSTYSNYLITYSGVITTTGNNTADLYFKYRYAGPNTQTNHTFAFNGVNSVGTGFTAGDTTLGAGIISRNLGDKNSGQMFVKQVGNSSEYGALTGQNFDPWGEEIINYGVLAATNRVYLGFIISASVGDISGTFTVYGLAKS